VCLAAVCDLDGQGGWFAGLVVDVHIQLRSASGMSAGGAQPDQDRDAEDLQHVHVAGVVAADVGAAVEHPHPGVAYQVLGECRDCPCWTDRLAADGCGRRTALRFPVLVGSDGADLDVDEVVVADP
jgi:hypothetical protein